MGTFSNLGVAIEILGNRLQKHSTEVNPGHWQGTDTSGNADMGSVELLNVHFMAPMPPTTPQLVLQVKPDLPWADEHFDERVSRQALNPPPSYTRWPHHQRNPDEFRTADSRRFSHTYPERYWPTIDQNESFKYRYGIRYRYGDLDDVIDLLLKYPYTRQAYLPVWFPEDTGAAHGERVPCTLGYHFIRRNDQLHVNYFIRSCDYLRHFRNDIYLTVRLVHWVLDQLKNRRDGAHWRGVKPGQFTMFITSLHVFVADAKAMNWRE